MRSAVRRMLSHEEVVRLYGPWRARTPQELAQLLSGYDGRWWIAGGWAIEAFSGVPRRHDDVDPSIVRSHVSLLRRYLADRLDVWAADCGTLCPLLGDLSANAERVANRSGSSRCVGWSGEGHWKT